MEIHDFECRLHIRYKRNEEKYVHWEVHAYHDHSGMEGMAGHWELHGAIERAIGRLTRKLGDSSWCCPGQDKVKRALDPNIDADDPAEFAVLENIHSTVHLLKSRGHRNTQMHEETHRLLGEVRELVCESRAATEKKEDKHWTLGEQ